MKISFCFVFQLSFKIGQIIPDYPDSQFLKSVEAFDTWDYQPKNTSRERGKAKAMEV
jgi:hypothetical protein